MLEIENHSLKDSQK